MLFQIFSINNFFQALDNYTCLVCNRASVIDSGGLEDVGGLVVAGLLMSLAAAVRRAGRVLRLGGRGD